MKWFSQFCALTALSCAMSLSAIADSTSMRKKEPMSFTLDFNDPNEELSAASIGYSFTPQFELSVASSYGKGDITRDFRDEFDMPNGVFLYGGKKEHLSVSLNSRIFIGNSFSFLFGAGAQRSTHELGIFDNSYLWYLLSTLKSEHIKTSLGVGNQWTFDNGLILGVDWAVFSRAVLTRESTSYESSDLGDEQIKTINEGITRWLQDLAQIPLTRTAAIHIGFRF